MSFAKDDWITLFETLRTGVVIGHCPVDGWPRVRWPYGGDSFVKPDCARLATLEERPDWKPSRRKQKQTA